ncbi:FAD-dependent oxidoreductase [Mycobacterium kyorinense]
MGRPTITIKGLLDSPLRADDMREVGEAAIVLGASISGLLAARVLADFYRTVTVVERDILIDRPTTRRGVPQGGLPHITHPRATQIMSELFPGFLDELVVGGAQVWNDGDLSRLWMRYGGHRLLRSGTIPDPKSVAAYYVTRPFLEWSVRRRVHSMPNVEILGGHDAVRLASSADSERVTGVVVARRRSGAEKTLAADLVVDATGRGSRTPVFLDALGYRPPRQDQLMVRVAYAGLLVHVPPRTLREYFAFAGAESSRPMGFGMVAGENNTYMLGVQPIAGQPPPSDRDSLLACLADMAPSHVLTAARCAEPLTDVAHYRFPSNRWRRYDKLARTPDGLLVVGDAMCSFNPVYGQGISVAAIEAIVLRHCLQHGDRNLPRRFFHATAKEIRVAWHAAVGSDLALPQTPGRPSLSIRISNAYLNRLLAAAETDPAAVQQFLRLMGMVDPPSRLLRPSTIIRVINASQKQPDQKAMPAGG